MKEKSKYNYFVDLEKFIFSIVIVFYHTWQYFYNDGCNVRTYFMFGYYAVDFYFIVTGYLMMSKIANSKKYENLGIDTFNFIKNKILRLLPYVLISYFIGAMYLYGKDFLKIKFLLSDDVWTEILQLNSITNTRILINSATWYISAMFFSLLLLYPLARKYDKTYTYMIAPILLFFTLTIVYSYNINVNDPNNISGFLGKSGLYKAIIFIILGNLSYELAEKTKGLSINRLRKVIITFVEIGIFAFLVYNMYFYVAGKVFVALCTFLLVALNFSNQSYTGKIFGCKINKTLGKIGFIMFLNNIYLRNYFLYKYKYVWSYRKYVFYVLVYSFIISVGIYIILDILPKVYKKMRRSEEC